MVKILVIGSGAREHAIIKSLNKSKKEKEIYCLASNNNPGISDICNELKIVNINNAEIIKDYSIKQSINIAIIGPENPLAHGVADSLWEAGIGVVGPKKNLAQIETSKSFTRNLLKEYKIPGCPKFKTFTNMEGVEDFLSLLGDNYVVKYDGLAGGKGVKVAGDHLHSHEEALSYCKELIESGGHFVIERKLIGEEFSLMSFSDGENLVHMPAVQDHKRAYEGDEGPNTGGMGTYSDKDHSLPFLNKEDVNKAKETNEKIITALYKKFGERYIGVLYGGFMVTEDGVKVIEYNARFGDPEAMNVLSILESDFLSVCISMIDGKLKSQDVSFERLATVCKYVVPVGYPDKPEKNFEVFCDQNDRSLFLASVRLKDQKLIACGSRTAAVVGKNKDVFQAELFAVAGIAHISGNLFHRKDIGTKKLIDSRIKRMKELLQ